MSDFAMIRGDTKTLDVVLTNADGTPLDLTGLTLTFTAAMPWHTDPTITKTVGDGIEVTSAEEGECTVTIDPDDTEAVDYWWGPPYRYAWDFEVQDGDEVRTPLRGRLVVYSDVTRATA